MSACAPAEPEVVTLKMVSAWPWDCKDLTAIREWVDRVNTAGAGVVQIDYLGAGEVFPSHEQAAPLQKGVIDLLFTSPSYGADIFPEPLATVWNFGASSVEFREAGLTDRIDEIGREKAGIGLLGIPWIGNFHIYTTKPIEKMEDLSRMRIRKVLLYSPIFKGIGIPAVEIKFSEVYTALERGLIDGTTYPYHDITTYGWDEVCNYRIDPPILRSCECPLMYNVASFDALPAQAKKILTDVVLDIERDAANIYDAQSLEEWKELKAGGMEVIWLTDEEWYQMQEFNWVNGKELFQELAPDHADELFDMLSVFYPPKQVFPSFGD